MEEAVPSYTWELHQNLVSCKQFLDDNDSSRGHDADDLAALTYSLCGMSTTALPLVLILQIIACDEM